MDIFFDSSFQFIGNTYAYQEVSQWLSQYKPEQRLTSASCMVLSGPNGIGKTTLIKYLAFQNNYHIHWISSDICDSGKSLQDMLRKYTQSTIEDAWGDKSKSIIVIDALDVLVSNDRNLFMTFCTLLTKNTTLPDKALVCICEPNLVKKLTEHKMYQTHVSMKPISSTDICIYLKICYPAINASTILQIGDTCDGNLVHALELANFEKVDIKHEETIPLNPSLSNKNLIEKIPDMSELYVQKSITSWIKLFSLEPWMHPLRFHENFLKEMENSRKLKHEKCQIYNELLSVLIEWDTLMGFILENNMDNTILELPLEIFSRNSIQILEKLKRHYPLKHSNESMTEFTKLLSQLSLQKKYCQHFFETYNGDTFPIHELPYYWFHTDT
jgi:hypothetical protein